MKVIRPLRRIGALLALTALLLIAACGGEAAAPTATPQPPTATAPAAAPAATTAPAANESGGNGSGGATKLVQLFVDPPTFDPHLTTDATSARIIVEVFGGLVTIDPELQIAPDLAESWDVSADGRVYTFHLRPGAVFHDGKPVTAGDVRWSLERATNPLTESPVVDQYLGDIVGVKEKLAGDAATIAGVRVIDDQTIEITIDEAKSYFLAKLTYPTGFVLDQENVDADPAELVPPAQRHRPLPPHRVPGGGNAETGPQRKLSPGAADAGGSGIHPKRRHAVADVRKRRIHIAGVSLADLDRLNDPDNELYPELRTAPASFSVNYIGLNVNEPPLDDVKVRQALNWRLTSRKSRPSSWAI